MEIVRKEVPERFLRMDIYMELGDECVSVLDTSMSLFYQIPLRIYV